MCNCNKGRANYNAVRSNSVGRNNLAGRNTATPGGMVKVQLVSNSPVAFYGSFTGKAYKLKNANEIGWVDKRDAANLRGVVGLKVFN